MDVLMSCLDVEACMHVLCDCARAHTHTHTNVEACMDVLGDRNKHVLAVCCVQACMEVLADRNNHPVAFYCTAGTV